MRSARWPAGLVLLLAVSAVDARVVFDNGVTTLSAAISSNPQSQNIVADDFRLEAGSNVITDVHWTGVYQSNDVPLADAFRLQIYDDINGMPDSATARDLDTLGATFRLDTGETLGFEIYGYSVDVAPVVLDPDTTYWLSIFNDTVAGPYNWSWAGRNGSSGNAHSASPSGSSWFDQDFEADFQLTSVVPEPAALALLVIGLLGLGARRRPR